MLRPARPCDDLRWEANRVAAVVDPCRSGLDRVEAGGKQWDQRLHEVPVRDGRTVGSRRRALGIDVDPLVVTGSVSERVNPVLVDCQPIAGTQVSPTAAQISSTLENTLGTITRRRAWWPLPQAP